MGARKRLPATRVRETAHRGLSLLVYALYKAHAVHETENTFCSFYLFSSNITWRSWFSSIPTYSVSPANKVVISLLLVNDFWLYVCESTQRRSYAAILPNSHLVFAWLLLFPVLSRFYIRHHRHAAFPVGLQLYDIGSARP